MDNRGATRLNENPKIYIYKFTPGVVKQKPPYLLKIT